MQKDFIRDPVRILNREQIKYIAIIAMTLNHTAHALLTPGTVLYEALEDIGYITAMVMAYFLVEGYHHTRSVRKYALRLLVFALISQLPYVRSQGYTQLNMLFTVLIGLGVLTAMRMERYGKAAAGFLILISLWSDWGVLFPVTVMYLEKNRRESLLSVSSCDAVTQKVDANSRPEDSVSPGEHGQEGNSMQPDESISDQKGKQIDGRLRVYLIIAAAFALSNTVSIIDAGACSIWMALLRGVLSSVGILIAAVLVLYLYNGKTAVTHRSFHKWFFYIYYPLHLTVLWGLKALL